MDTRLSRGSEVGNMDTLYTLIRENVYILEKIDEPPFGTTPLHIAAENGHIEFATAIMYLKPSFASKLDQCLLSPMHLALQKGNTEMVLWLSRLDNNLVRVKGRDGMTPFHYAVVQENLHLLVAFLDTCPECVKDINVRGENAMHIALKNNSFEAFKVLLGWVRRNTHPNCDIWEKELFRGKDTEGNTVLHIAAYINHHEAIQLLAKYYPVQRKAKNLEDLTAQDILQHNERQGQAQSMQSQRLLSRTSFFESAVISSSFASLKTEVSKFKDFNTFITRQRMKIDGNTRNAMLVVTILVMTIVFQGVYSPAGGLWPANDSNNIYPSPICNMTCTNHPTSPRCNVTCNNSKPIPNKNNSPPPGTAVMNKARFRFVWFTNTYTLILAYALTIYLLPPGYADRLFNAILLGLASSYALSLTTISPSSYLGKITFALFFCFYIITWAILSSKRRHIFMLLVYVFIFTIAQLSIEYLNFHD